MGNKSDRDQQGPRAYSPVEAAEVLGVSKSTVYDYMASGLLPFRQLSPRVRRIPADAIDALLSEDAA